MSATIYRFSCSQLGLCQRRTPDCSGFGCVKADAAQPATAAQSAPTSTALGGGNFWLDGHRVSQLDAGRDVQEDVDDYDETDEGLGWVIVRALGWLAFGLCALVGAATLAGMAWQHLARWLA